MLMRFDPFREFDRAVQQVWNGDRTGAMPMDAYRRGDSFIVQFDLPGIDSESIEITVEKNVLTVKAARTWTRAEGDEILVAERRHGSFSRQLFLGEGLDPDGIEAHYDSGVLTLTVPVAERAKPRKLNITAGSPDRQAIKAG